MAYDEELAERIRERLEGEPGVTEKRMFGGLAFLSEGHMAIAASGQGGLLARADPDQPIDAEPMIMRGRPMRGWYRVEEPDDATLAEWIDRGLAYVRTLEPK